MNRLLDFLKQQEGYRSRPYWDQKQWSVGYGTRASGPGDTVNRAQAEQRLSQHANNAYSIVDRFAPNLPAGIRDALADLTYNAGGKWTRSGLGSLVKRGDYSGARQRFLQYNKAGGRTLPGLQRRRQAAASWFDGGTSPQVAGWRGQATTPPLPERNPQRSGTPPLPGRNPRRQQPNNVGWQFGSGEGEDMGGGWSINWSDGTPAQPAPAIPDRNSPQVQNAMRQGPTPGSFRAAQEVGMTPTHRSAQDFNPKPKKPIKPLFGGGFSFSKGWK